ncbi:hypothetical protein H8E88_25885 [candidate division KSB1 bacterium]|nr:hypothetical protein [candidate division KSB1 bacterium]
MNKCIDFEKGRLIGRYEFNLLTPGEKEEFEEHILKCDFCFRELYEFSPAVKLMKENLKQFKKTMTGKLTFYEKIKSYVPNFIPEPVKPAIPALGFVFVAIIFLSTIWPIVKPSLITHQKDVQPSKIVLQDAEEMAQKGDIEKLNEVDSSVVNFLLPELIKEISESMNISFSRNGDSLIFSWHKIEAAKSYHISLVFKDDTILLTPTQGISDSMFIYASNNDYLEKIDSWELKAYLFNGSILKIQKKFK